MIGQVLFYYGLKANIHSDYLCLDGSTFNAATYPLLYALLGNSNTLPDFRGQFIRCQNTSGSGLDANRALGDIQAQSI